MENEKGKYGKKRKIFKRSIKNGKRRSKTHNEKAV